MPDDVDTSPLPTGRLAPWQRWLLALGGVLFAGLGVTAMFLTDNEAGTAVAVLLSGVLLVVAVQGTGVQKITVGDRSVQLASIRRAMAERATAAAATDPEGALETLDSYAAADPGARDDPSIAAARATIEAQRAAP